MRSSSERIIEIVRSLIINESDSRIRALSAFISVEIDYNFQTIENTVSLLVKGHRISVLAISAEGLERGSGVIKKATIILYKEFISNLERMLVRKLTDLSEPELLLLELMK